LKTVSDAPLLQVYDQDGSAMLAYVTGTNNPVAVLDDKTVDLLFNQSRKARAEVVKAAGDAGAALELLATLDGVLKSYRKIRDEYYDRIDIEREREEAEQRLQDASNAINSPPPSD